MFLLIAFFAFNLFVGLTKPLWLDEVYTLNLIHTHSVFDLIKNMFQGADTNPPFYFILVYFIGTFSKSIILFRLLSLLFSIGGVYYIVKLLLNYVEQSTVFILMIIVVVSSFFSQYLIVEIRPYALYFLLSSLFLYHYHKISFLGKSDVKEILKFLTVTLLLLYTHYFALFYVFIALIFEIALNRSKNKNVLIAISSALILFIPWFIAIHNQYYRIHGYTWQSTPSIYQFIKSQVNFFNLYLIISLVVLISIGLVLNSIEPKKTKIDNFILLFIVYSFLPFIDYLFSILNISVFTIRYFIPSYLGLIIIAALLLEIFAVSKIKYIVVPFVLIAAIVGINLSHKYFKKEQLRENSIDNTLILNDKNVPIICTSAHQFYPLNYYAKEKMGKSNFYYILDEQSARESTGNKFALYDFYLNSNLKQFYKMKNLIRFKTVKKKFNSFYLFSNGNRILFDNRFRKNPEYSIKKIRNDLFYISKKVNLEK